MDKFIFEIKDNSAILIAYSGKEINLIIPDEYNGYPVTRIHKSAFILNCEHIETLVLPKYLESFESIYSFSFWNLKKMTFLNEKTKLNFESIRFLNELEEINIFAWKYLLTKQIINVFWKKLDNWDTLDNNEQKQILSTIKRTPSIKKNLFLSENINIILFLIEQKININLETINEILDYYIEKETTNITAILFEYKNNKFSKEIIEKTKENNELVEIGLELPTLKQLKQKWNVGKVNGGLRISGYKGSNTTETIPTGTIEGDLIVAIGSSKNNSFEPIKNLIIDAKIEILSKQAFLECHSLTSIELPETLKTIDNYAFYDCSNLVDIKFPDGLENINIGVFKKCTSLETVVIPNSVNNLKEDIFSFCENLKNITLPSSIKEIPSYTFSGCENLEEIIIPNSVEVINKLAFSNCHKLKSMTISSSIKTIFDNAFNSCHSIEKIVFPKSLQSIDKSAFAYCLNLKTIEFNSEVEMGGKTFKRCIDVEIIQK